MREKEFREKTISKHVAFQGKLLTLFVDEVTTPNGIPAQREFVDHPGAVAIVALDDDRHVLLVRQFRYALQRMLVELPAGKLDRNETPEQCARRELREETGWDADRWDSLGCIYASAGYSTEKIFFFLARSLKHCPLPADPDEYLSVESQPLSAILRDIEEGRCEDSKLLAGALLAWRFLERQTVDSMLEAGAKAKKSKID